ncbi:NUDIX domain-containing protein [Glycomyces sp. L485]|uniref:NUDIX hydrolase n=1 Tax=Glycomyces sp. L485 TaxID=2909235 RepID=UPI001F4A943F|nr:NUDIX domain-containing protein [Glycomyces sp. L485]MCH7230399.1 NUDIX domain-containing protein [Glycomyces sp. L485]
MADENAAAGLARLAGILRAEAANGLYWGAEEDELARLHRIRGYAVALTAEVDHRSPSEIAAIFEADEVLRSPMPATEFRIRCADGTEVVQRRRLTRDRASLGRRLADLGETLRTDAPTDVVAIGDTDLAGLACPHTFLLAYEAETPLTAATVRESIEPSDPDLEGEIEHLIPAASAVTPERGPLPVTAKVKELLDEVAAVAKSGRTAATGVYSLERHERIEDLCEHTVEADLAYQRIDCGDLAAEGLPTGADAAIFDEGDRLLLIRRTDTGQWAMPGGAAEVGETVGTAAVREALEETGLDVTVTGLSWAFDKRDLDCGDGRFPMIMSFSARLDDPDQPIRLAELEASDHRWIAEDEIDGIDFFQGHELRVPAAFAGRDRSAS